MISLLEDITQCGQKNTKLYMMKTDTGDFIIAIPKINWSAELQESDTAQQRIEHIHASLTFHMYDGDIDTLAHMITMYTMHYDEYIH